MPHQITPARLIPVRSPGQSFSFFVLLAFSILIAACASNPEREPGPPPTYPPPPEQARLIYDGSLRSSSDIVEPGFGEKLQAFATGTRIDPDGLAKPYGIAVKNQRIFISDTQQRAILMFDLVNRQFKIFGREGKGSLLKPLGIDISPENEIYVIDITAKRIVVFDFDGNYLRGIGSDGLFVRPSGLALDTRGERIYVSDTGGIESDKHRVLVLDAKTGKLIQTIGKRGREPGQFNLPLQIATSKDGRLYVVDSGNFRVQAFDADGKFMHSFGSAGRRPGQFSRPKGITTDNDNNVYVVDTAFGNFQMFNPEGQLLMHVGDRGASGLPGFYMLPAGIDVDEAGRVYLVDQFFRKIDIFRPASLPSLEGIPRF